MVDESGSFCPEPLPTSPSDRDSPQIDRSHTGHTVPPTHPHTLPEPKPPKGRAGGAVGPQSHELLRLDSSVSMPSVAVVESPPILPGNSDGLTARQRKRRTAAAKRKVTTGLAAEAEDEPELVTAVQRRTAALGIPRTADAHLSSEKQDMIVRRLDSVEAQVAKLAIAVEQLQELVSSKGQHADVQVKSARGGVHSVSERELETERRVARLEQRLESGERRLQQQQNVTQLFRQQLQTVSQENQGLRVQLERLVQEHERYRERSDDRSCSRTVSGAQHGAYEAAQEATLGAAVTEEGEPQLGFSFSWRELVDCRLDQLASYVGSVSDQQDEMQTQLAELEGVVCNEVWHDVGQLKQTQQSQSDQLQQQLAQLQQVQTVPSTVQPAQQQTDQAVQELRAQLGLMDQRLRDLERQQKGQPAIWIEFEKIGEVLRERGKVDTPEVRLRVLQGKLSLSGVADR